jgi:deoxyadenosine/deoxycytidine kinase
LKEVSEVENPLSNLLSYDLGLTKVLEEVNTNPFTRTFYEGPIANKFTDVNLGVEMTFLMLHYCLSKDSNLKQNYGVILSDFSIEKDWGFAKMDMKV